jgi:hypothetical protein
MKTEKINNILYNWYWNNFLNLPQNEFDIEINENVFKGCNIHQTFVNNIHQTNITCNYWYDVKKLRKEKLKRIL